METKLYRKYRIIILLLLFVLVSSCSLFKALATPLDINHEHLLENNMTFGCGEGISKYYCGKTNCTFKHGKYVCGEEIGPSQSIFSLTGPICEDEPCGGIIYGPGRRLCNDEFISIQTPCNGTCIDETYDTFCSGQDWREYGAKDVCIKRNQSCYGKCLHQDIPILMPVEHQCTSESKCVSKGFIFDEAHYMCNGQCIPVYIPCNNTCIDNVTWDTNRKAELFGPIKCTQIATTRLPPSYDPFALPEEKFLYIKHYLSKYHNSSWCLPGYTPCNESCIVDPRMSLLQEKKFPRRMECEVVCDHRNRQWACGDKCISSEESCHGECREGYWKCKSTNECIRTSVVCDGYSSMDCKDGSDEEECPNCGENGTMFCDGVLVCHNSSIPCKGQCLKRKSYFKKLNVFDQDYSSRVCGDYCLANEIPCNDQCSDGMVLCPDKSKCIYIRDSINNGVKDCNDGSDENLIMTDEIEIKKFGKIDLDDIPVRHCHGKFVNASEPCDGMCWEDYWQPCLESNRTCTRKHILSPIPGTDMGYGPAKALENIKCQKNIQEKSFGKENCTFHELWVCDDRLICSDEPCISQSHSENVCPDHYYLCGTKCHPNFLSCNKTCRNGGFLCNQLGINITKNFGNGNISFNTFLNMGYKKYSLTPGMWFQYDLNRIFDFMLYCVNAQDGFNITESFDELCCLPPEYQCDGIIECRNVDDRSDEDTCNGCRNGLGFCDGTLTCLDKKMQR